MQLADVYLDTIGFSGFNSAMRAVECGLPIVTQEGRFLRGRLASGILKRINLSELVSASKEEYISMAVKLSTDKRYRQSIKERMEQSRHLLFNDLEPIHALEDFITVVCRPSSRCAETPTWKRTTNFPWSSEQLVIRRNVPPGQ
jgi:predicted O-linked N-acetylglucosamine transferase (SPINDLY family)